MTIFAKHPLRRFERALPPGGAIAGKPARPRRLGRADLRSADPVFAVANTGWGRCCRSGRRLIAALLATVGFGGALAAQEPMTPAEFGAMAESYTLYFSENGNHYGSEQYLSDRRTVWRDSNGRCVNGKWSDIDGAMCFVYDDDSGVHCWTLSREGERIFVLSTNDPPERPPTLLELSRKDDVPISCRGPRVGV